MMQRAVRGVRGATTAADNTVAAMTSATQKLVQALLEQNDIDLEQIAAILFTVSPDLDATFPAEAARKLGLHHVPLMTATEIDVPNSLNRCIRVLMLINTNVAQRDIRHVYLGEARTLRPDLAADDNSKPSRPQPRAATKKIEPYIPGMSIEDARREYDFYGEFVKLASNENPLGPSPRSVAAVADALREMHTYPDGAYKMLRDALSRFWDLPPEYFIVGNGSDGIIKMIGEAYLEMGDEIVCADPTFSQYGFAADLAGARTVKVPLDRDLRHDLSAMADAIGPHTKAVFICNPNNPTGTTVTKEQFDAFMKRVPSHVLVVIDEAYGEYADENGLQGKDWVQRSDHHVIVLRTFSKIYGLAGLRVGYGIAPPIVIDTLRKVQEPFQVNAAAQLAAIEALQDEGHVRTSRRMNDEGRRFFYGKLAALGLQYVPTEANFVFFNVERDSREVCAQLLKRGIIVRGGEAFGLPTWLRVTIGTAEQNERLFDALSKVLR